MPIDRRIALEQIDAISARRTLVGDLTLAENIQELITLYCAVIHRLAPPASPYLEQMKSVLEKTEGSYYKSKEEAIEPRLRGIISALRADYELGRLQSFQELIHADIFSDFLEMAEFFLSEGFKDAAAVIAGGVLEEHLRKLCAKHGISPKKRPKLDTMNTDLARVDVYNKNSQKQVTAWAAIRNDAAHANYGNYTKAEVHQLVAGVRDFVGRNPA